MAAQFLAKVNNLRASKGVGPLSGNGTLNSMAVGWSNHMASTGTLSHNPRLSSDAPPGWVKLGENVGYGSTVDQVYNAFVASSSHYPHMVDPAFTLTGVGVSTDGSGREVKGTQEEVLL